MKSLFRIFIDFVLLAIAAFTGFSCDDSNNAGGSGNTGPKEASLSYQNYRTYYAVGMENKNDGNLMYTSPEGSVMTIDNSLSNERVTVTGFDTSMAGIGKIMTITYEGVSCSAKYDVYSLDDVSISGSYIVADDTIYDVNIAANAGSIVCKKYENWSKYLDNSFTSFPAAFERDVNSSGKTVLRTAAGELRIALYPDGQGGIRDTSYKKASDFAKPASGKYYVSNEQERSNSEHNGEYLIARFDDDYNLNLWFKGDNSTEDLAAAPSDVISNANLHFGLAGLFYMGKNISNQHEFRIRESSSSTAWDAILVTSMYDSEASWKGYSYTINLKKD